MRVDLSDPHLVAAKLILIEMEYGLSGNQAFNAAAPVLDWGAVKLQMLYIHGCAKLTEGRR